MKPSCSDYSFYCSSCDYWASNLKPDLQSETLQISEDNSQKTSEIDIAHLDNIRQYNFDKIISQIHKIFGGKKVNILDIGCGTGLFMKMAADHGFNILGIEPNKSMFDIASARDLEVREGLFPDVLETQQKFDVIILNDVFEHLENIEELLSAISKHLSEGGQLIINLPSAKGIIFFIAKYLAIMGYRRPWDRLWQKMFYTPHLHYFSTRSLKAFLGNNGFEAHDYKVSLKTLSLGGLWKRLGVDPNSNLLERLSVYFAMCIIIPIQTIIAPDAIVLFAKIKNKV